MISATVMCFYSGLLKNTGCLLATNSNSNNINNSNKKNTSEHLPLNFMQTFQFVV